MLTKLNVNLTRLLRSFCETYDMISIVYVYLYGVYAMARNFTFGKQSGVALALTQTADKLPTIS